MNHPYSRHTRSLTTRSPLNLLTNRLFLVALGMALFPWISSAQEEVPIVQEVRLYDTLDGSVEKISRDGFVLRSKTNVAWNLFPDPERGIQSQSYEGTAEFSFLKAGMIVQFEADIAKGQVKNAVESFMIITPQTTEDVGLIPIGGGKVGVMGDKKSKQPKGQGRFQVGGKLTSLKGRKFMVDTGVANIKGEFDENCKISVKVSHLEYVREGDSITAKMWFRDTERPNCFATNIEVKGAKPLEPKAAKKGKDSDEKKAKPEKMKPEKSKADKKEKMAKAKAKENNDAGGNDVFSKFGNATLKPAVMPKEEKSR